MADVDLHAANAQLIATAPARRRRAAKRDRHSIRRFKRLLARNEQRAYRSALRRAYKHGFYTRIHIPLTNSTLDIHTFGRIDLDLRPPEAPQQ